MDVTGHTCVVLLVWLPHFLLVASYEIGDLRLADGPTPNAGRVEFYLGFRGWYSTCDVMWGIDDAIVVCRQLGFPGAALARSQSPYGGGAGVPLARDWQCRGDENQLQDCKFIPKPRCEETVGVVCQAPGYLGCFADSGSPLTSILRDGFVALDRMSVSACREHCTAANSRLAGLKNGQECYCGQLDDAMLPANRQSDRQCQVPCAGNPDEICGGLRSIVKLFGLDRLSVYDLSLGRCDVPTQPANGRSLGNEYAYGDVIHFECQKGYKLSNASAVAALCVMVVDGTGKTVDWNSSVPTCQATLENSLWRAQEEQFMGYDTNDRQYIFVAVLAGIVAVLTSAIMFIIVKRKMANRRATIKRVDPPPCYQDLVMDYERIADPKTGIFPPERDSCYQTLRPPLPNRPAKYAFRVNVPGHPSYPESSGIIN